MTDWWQNSPLAGTDPFEEVPMPLRGTVKQMVEGRMAPPTGAALRSPQVLQLLQHANKVDPAFDANVWSQRNASVKDFSAGKSAEMVRSANQTIHHVGSLVDTIDKLQNGQYPAINYIGNEINTKIRGKSPVTEFLPNAHAVAEEMSKVFKGGNLSDAEIKQWEQSLSPNMSPEQHKAAVGKLLELLHGSLTALEEKRLGGMGPALAEKQGPIIKDDAKKVLERVERWRTGAPVKVSTPEEAAKLPSGTRILLPDGSPGVVP